MQFSELRDRDVYNTFSDFMSISEAKSIGLIPIDFQSYFPDSCDCGSEYIITKDLTQPQCCDPRCFIKLGYALAEMFTRFTCTGIGEETCKTIMKELHKKLLIPSHVEILTLEQKDWPEVLYGAKGFTFVDAIQHILNQNITYGDMIACIAIPEYNEEARKLFSYFNGTKELLTAIDSDGGYKSFLEQRGVKDTRKAYVLREYMRDIAFAETALFDQIRMKGKHEIHICITGEVYPNGSRMIKSEFKDLCNKITTMDNGYKPIEIVVTGAKESCFYIIADYKSSTPKYLAGERRQRDLQKSDPTAKILYTSTEFLEYLRELMKNVR